MDKKNRYENMQKYNFMGELPIACDPNRGIFPVKDG